MLNSNKLTKFSSLFIASTTLLLAACDSSDNSPSSTTNVVVSVDLPSNVIRLIDEQRVVHSQLTYAGNTEEMDFLLNGTSEKTIENYDLASISVNVLLSIENQGALISLAKADITANMNSGSENRILITQFDYFDSDGDGSSNLLEVINNTDPEDPNTFPISANKSGAKSQTYTVEHISVSKMNYSPSSNSYQIGDTSRSIIGAPHSVTRSAKQFLDGPLYEIRTE